MPTEAHAELEDAARADWESRGFEEDDFSLDKMIGACLRGLLDV
jgi:hypothetical protein